jgi:hypothetical protein
MEEDRPAAELCVDKTRTKKKKEKKRER